MPIVEAGETVLVGKLHKEKDVAQTSHVLFEFDYIFVAAIC
jgi:hypothetical protein